MSATAVRLKVFVVVLSAVLFLSTLGFAFFERLPVVDALYFSVVTVATVGYGDIHPVTPAGRLLAVVLIVTGVGTFLGVVANATDLLLARRHERVRKERLSMIVGLFFSEIGTELLRRVSACDPELPALRRRLGLEEINATWSEEDFDRVAASLARHRFPVAPECMELESLRCFLGEKGALLLRLLENQNLLEHESFTDLLRAVFHLREELGSRADLAALPQPDLLHLAGDMHRIYPLLVRQWVSHMEYLKRRYPYLFSLAVRTNPFLETACAVVREG